MKILHSFLSRHVHWQCNSHGTIYEVKGFINNQIFLMVQSIIAMHQIHSIVATLLLNLAAVHIRGKLHPTAY